MITPRVSNVGEQFKTGHNKHFYVFVDYKFESEKNSLNLIREYYQDFSCEFDLLYYPFDTQVWLKINKTAND